MPCYKTECDRFTVSELETLRYFLLPKMKNVGDDLTYYISTWFLTSKLTFYVSLITFHHKCFVRVFPTPYIRLSC